jgi:hypothetical protein
MIIRVNSFLLPILGGILIPAAFLIRLYPIFSIQFISSLMAGVGVGLLGAFFLFPPGKNWVEEMNRKLEDNQ